MGRVGKVGQVGRVGIGTKLPRDFYNRPTLDVARDLIGKILIHRTHGAHGAQGTLTSGVIVEVEAYIGESDPACHAAPGPTRRNAPLYGPPGFSYVYLNYGIHSLVNVITEAEGCPAAVLIRALDPADGIATMRRRRGRSMKGRHTPRVPDLVTQDLCRGPGNLTMAMGITLAENGIDLLGDRLFIEDHGRAATAVLWGSRIGIRVGTERPWRAWVEGHPAVSGPRGAIGSATARELGTASP